MGAGAPQRTRAAPAAHPRLDPSRRCLALLTAAGKKPMELQTLGEAGTGVLGSCFIAITRRRRPAAPALPGAMYTLTICRRARCD